MVRLGKKTSSHAKYTTKNPSSFFAFTKHWSGWPYVLHVLAVVIGVTIFFSLYYYGFHTIRRMMRYLAHERVMPVHGASIPGGAVPWFGASTLGRTAFIAGLRAVSIVNCPDSLPYNRGCYCENGLCYQTCSSVPQPTPPVAEMEEYIKVSPLYCDDSTTWRALTSTEPREHTACNGLSAREGNHAFAPLCTTCTCSSTDEAADDYAGDCPQCPHEYRWCYAGYCMR